MRVGYKQTEVGVIPEDWEVYRLNEHFRIFAGGDVPWGSLSTFHSEEHPVPIYANSLQHAGLYGYTANSRAAANSITITARGTLGRAVYRDHEHMPVGRLLVLEPKGKLDAEYATSAINERVTFPVESTGVPQLTAPQVGTYSIGGPSNPNEQRAIAAALADADAAVEGFERLIAKKRDLKQAAMQQLLTCQTRLPGFSDAWEVKRLGDMGRFLKGFGVRRDQAQSGELPCVRYGEIYTTHNDVVRAFTSFISREVAKTAVRLQNGDLLFAGSGETKQDIGKCVAFLYGGEAYAGGDIIILRPSSGCPHFLGYLLNTTVIAKQKANFGQGDAVVHIGSASLAKIEVTLPDEAEQTAIATVLSDMDAELAALQAQLDKTRLIKKAMMQDLLTGRVRLPFQ